VVRGSGRPFGDAGQTQVAVSAHIREANHGPEGFPPEQGFDGRS
jgi:hypothetical protein